MAEILAPFNPISESAMNVVLELLHLGPHSVLFDLGAGDGRLLLSAATSIKSLRCVGIEIDPKFVERAELSLKMLPTDVRCRIQMRLGDALQMAEKSVASDDATQAAKHLCDELTIHDATAIFLFLLPKGLKSLKPLLDKVVERHKTEGRELRVATYMFHVPDWDPVEINRNTKACSPVYLYNFS